MPADTLKIVFKGKTVANEDTIEKLAIKETDFIVVMAQVAVSNQLRRNRSQSLKNKPKSNSQSRRKRKKRRKRSLRKRKKKRLSLKFLSSLLSSLLTKLK